MTYTFEREELVQLLVRAYNEGNCGFLDLAESVAEKLVDEQSYPRDDMPTVNDITNGILTRNLCTHDVQIDTLRMIVDNLAILHSNNHMASKRESEKS